MVSWRHGEPIDGNCPASAYIKDMMEKSTSMRTLPLRERQRIAAEDGAKAIAEYKAAGIAIRKNMARLRALRLAREAEEAAPARRQRKKTI